MFDPIKAAEQFHPSEYIAEELQARGWSVRDLAERMGGDVDVNHCALEIYFAVAQKPELAVGCHLEGMADQLGTALGTGPEIWRNLERSYIASVKAQKERQCPST